MRILIIGSYGPSLLNFRAPLIKALKSAGHEIHVAAPELGKELCAGLEAIGAIPHETPLQRQGTGLRADLAYFQCLHRLFKKIRPDMAITYTIKPNIWGAFAGARTNVRTAALVTGLGIAFTDTGKVDGLKNRFVKALARWLYRRASNRHWRMVFQNPDDLNDFEAAGCLESRAKVRMMNGSGVDLEYYAPSKLPESPNFLMISRILGAKGVREYALAALAVKKTHPQARFQLVGFFDEGPDAISKEEVDGWVSGGLEFLGPAGDVRPHLAASLCYVLPSYREGTPRSVLEAMAAGRAILTCDAPGCRETVENGVNGYLVPVGDFEALADRMRHLIENPDIAARMGKASLSKAREIYDVDKVNAKLMRDLELD